MSFLLCDVNRVPLEGLPECMTAAEAFALLGASPGLVVDTETNAIVTAPAPVEPTTQTDLGGL